MDRDGTGSLDIKEIKKFAVRLGQPLEGRTGSRPLRIHGQEQRWEGQRGGLHGMVPQRRDQEGDKGLLRQKTIQIFKEIDINNSGYLDGVRSRTYPFSLGITISDKKKN
ncbi:hypothetical protein ACHAW5_007237 [Stephanodiscus triporus]|uniref:EF-hand domain-containing protein n=1 Tax=Stephanodiscus triporus TaxID=2934178 RepID=A0ABD3NXL6_9STRA